MYQDLDVPISSWLLLTFVIVALLVIDLWRHRVPHRPSFRDKGKDAAIS